MADTPNSASAQGGVPAISLAMSQAHPTISQGDCLQPLGMESLPLTITTQPEITYGVSPPYYALFQHMTRPNPTILFPNSSEFSTPLNIGGTSQTSMTYNLPPLAREQIMQNLNAQLQFIQQQITLFS